MEWIRQLLRCAFQQKNKPVKKNMVEEFINSALIIDDKSAEVEKLLELLEQKDIWVKHYLPEDLAQRTTVFKNRKIIFLDLYVDETKELVPNIALIRNIFSKVIGKNFGTYGIILWTKHLAEIDEFKKKISNDGDKYDLPMFIIGLDKSPYLNSNDYSGIFEEINSKLKESTAAQFFIEWSTIVQTGKDKAISSVYSLIKDYNIQEDNLKFILCQLAQNYTGIPYSKAVDYPLHIDAFKAFNDMLHYEVANGAEMEPNLFNNHDNIYFTGTVAATSEYQYAIKNYIIGGMDDKSIKKGGNALTNAQKKEAGNKQNIIDIEHEIHSIYSEVNAKLLLENSNVKQEFIIPGNVYKILANDSELKINASEMPPDSTPIVIELTPPCDFAQMKMKTPRCIGGYLTDYINHTKIKGDHLYKEIWPIKLNDHATSQMIVFDFRYFGMIKEDELKNAAQYQILFRTKDKLFADIIQKFSSHIARLGLAIIK
jgi:hypothetical protein